MPHHVPNDGPAMPDFRTLPEMDNAELKAVQESLIQRGYACEIIWGYLQVKAMSLLDALHIVGIVMEYDVYSAKVANDATDCAYNIYVQTYSDPTGMSKPNAKH